MEPTMPASLGHYHPPVQFLRMDDNFVLFLLLFRVPFAEPPVGKLRLRDPVPKQGGTFFISSVDFEA